MISTIINADKLMAEAKLISIINRIHSAGPDLASDFEILAYLKKFHNEVFKKYEKKLLYILGLFYKVDEAESLIESIYSIYALSIEDETGNRFTPVQADIYKRIHLKKYFSFSAPTSAGKSFLFRELIQEADGDIVIVLPSRALIAEYMHAVMSLVDKSVLVLQFIENVNTSKAKRRIFIITPERGTQLFKYISEFNIELFLLDEAQISEEPIRGMKFDSFIRRADKLIPSAKKVFAHPFISNPEAQLQKHNFSECASSAKYEQQAVGKIYLYTDNDAFTYFSPYSDIDAANEHVEPEDIPKKVLENGGTLLVYISKAKIYDGRYAVEFSKYIESCTPIEIPDAVMLIERLREFIGAGKRSSERYSIMIEMMKCGIVLHHGSMPLKARLIIEEFVIKNYARICFATSTLNQGINMPFDVVWIDNFHNIGPLTLKNLIGRAGRTTIRQNYFDYGYTIVNKRNVKTFTKRLSEPSILSKVSTLDMDGSDVPEDLTDLVEAIKQDTFNDDLHLTNSQVDRLNVKEVFSDIRYILNNLLDGNGHPLPGTAYYKIKEGVRRKIKDAFKNIYIRHLRRDFITKSEGSILSAAIPIMLWQIQGKSFREVVSLRYAFLSRRDERRAILSQNKKGIISDAQADKDIKSLKIRYTPIAETLPNINVRDQGLFPNNTSVLDLDFDKLVYDTYDYLDKVISLSLVDPITAAFLLYYEKTKDNRALVMSNYIRYGTNDSIEIWLLRYGFSFDDIEWIKGHIESIDEKSIRFKGSIIGLNRERLKVIERFL